MRRYPLRGLVLLALTVGCTEAGTPMMSALDLGEDFVSSPQTRRAILERSLVNHENGYAQLRLTRYTEADWGALPEWNPRVRPAGSEDVGAGIPGVEAGWRELAVDEVGWDEGALVALGREVFTRYPAQIEPALAQALAEPGAPARYGLWERDGLVGGLVWVELPDGVQPAFTCSTCHARTGPDGELIWGLANANFDYGQLLDDYYGRVGLTGGWGPGRVDVTADEIENPTKIADLRVARYQTHYNRAATLHADLESLAVRLETAVVVNTGQVARPPRALIFAVSLYLWSLGEDLPELGQGPGREVFERECARCHVPPTLSGPSVVLDEVGTDPTVGSSPMRTTGSYQTPSLRGVGQRRKLLSDGSVPDLETLLDPGRETPGHGYGMELTATERGALLELLRAL